MIQNNYRNKYQVVINDDVYFYKYEKCDYDQPFLSFQPKHIFIGKSKVCPMTEFSGANDSSGFDGNTLLLEFENNDYVFISGLEIIKFKTEDKIIHYTSLTGNNMSTYAFAIGENYTYFIYHRYKFIENNKIEEGTLLNATDDSLDPYEYHVENCGVDSFKKLEHSLIHTDWPGHGDDIENEDDISDVEDEVEVNEDLIETPYLNGNNEVFKIFN